MPKPRFPFRLFFALLLTAGIATFFMANTVSVSTYTDQADMITPFPVVLELTDRTLQVVTAEQLIKLQLPDPQTQLRMEPHFLLNAAFFIDGTMPTKSIIGTSITNGQNIHIPTNYSAQVGGRQLADGTQEITITYTTTAEEDLLITALYTAHNNHYSRQCQYVKNVLIWKTIFMNGMMASLILSFVICKLLLRRKAKAAEPAP